MTNTELLDKTRQLESALDHLSKLDKYLQDDLHHQHVRIVGYESTSVENDISEALAPVLRELVPLAVAWARSRRIEAIEDLRRQLV